MLAGVAPLAHRLNGPAWGGPALGPNWVRPRSSDSAGPPPEGAAMLAALSRAHRQGGPARGGPALGPKATRCHLRD
jgi:hypothetical protein